MHASRKRRATLGVAATLAIAFVAIQFAVLQPLRAQARARHDELVARTAELRRSGWPLDYARLETRRGELERQRAQAEKRRAEILQKAAAPFKERILRRYESPEHFQRQVTRLDYQEEFKRLEKSLAGKGIHIQPATFKLSEDTTGVDNYKLVLQLWTVDAVVDAALAAELAVAQVVPEPTIPPASAEPTPAADLGVLPIVAYLAADHLDQPYLLRVPIRLRLHGTTSQVETFLLGARLGDVFFTVDRIEATRPVPPAAEYNRDLIFVDLECSTFYILDSEIGRSLMKRPEFKPMPRGA